MDHFSRGSSAAPIPPPLPIFSKHSTFSPKSANKTVHPKSISGQERIMNQTNDQSSGLQQDKRPFAYVASVNDPINRGKLDLSQIKSPAMKRRLLANMASSEESVDDEYIEPSERPKHELANETNKLLRHPIAEWTHDITAAQNSASPQPTISIVRYNNPPNFYDYQQDRQLNLLGLEIAESLEGLTQLISNIGVNQSNCLLLN